MEAVAWNHFLSFYPVVPRLVLPLSVRYIQMLHKQVGCFRRLPPNIRQASISLIVSITGVVIVW